MKVFKVYPEKWFNYEWSTCIIVAESEEAVRSMFYRDDECGCIRIGSPNSNYLFHDYQGEIHIEEVDLTKQDVILASYNTY